MSVARATLAGEKLNRWINSSEYFALEVGFHVFIVTGKVVDGVSQNLVQTAKSSHTCCLLKKGPGVHSNFGVERKRVVVLWVEVFR